MIPASVARFWSGLLRGLELFTASLFGLLTLDVLWGVFSRYVIGRQSRWTEEVAIFLLVWISMLGAALVYRSHGHLGIDYVVTKLDPVVRRQAALVSELVVLGFAVVILIYGGGVLVSETIQAGQVTAALGWQTGYLYSVVPLSGVFFTAFAIEHLVALRRSEVA